MRINLIFLFILISCAPLKYDVNDFDKSIYICEMGGMTGTYTLQFNRNTFLYSESDSLFVGGGKWFLSEDKKKVILIGKISNEHDNPNMPIVKDLNIELRIKTRNKLVGNGKVFLKKDY